MSRPLRVEFPGAFYHVMSRGNERSPIFRDDIDRRDFLDSLATAVLRESFCLHAYCLMGNHYHLLLETPLGKISRGMHWLNGRYALRFNARYERCGHLFEGRFRAIRVEREAHLLELQRYIVLNPVRAGLVDRPEDWPWSSYRATRGDVPSVRWLDVLSTIREFGPVLEAARRAFVEFVEAGIPMLHTASWSATTGITDPTPQETPLLLPCDDDCSSDPSPPPTLAEIEVAVMKEWGVSALELRRPRAGPAKVAAIYLTRTMTRLPAAEVGAAFGVRRGRVANVVAEIERGKLREMRPRLNGLIASLRGLAAERSAKRGCH